MNLSEKSLEYLKLKSQMGFFNPLYYFFFLFHDNKHKLINFNFPC